MDRGALWAAVHGVIKSRTRLSGFCFIFHFHALEKEMETHSSVLAWRIPEDRQAWWAAVYGVAQSRTRLKRLSSSSSRLHRGLPPAQTVKHLSTMQETWVQSLGCEDPLERKRQSTPVLLPGKSHGQRSLVGYSPWGHKEWDTTE